MTQTKTDLKALILEANSLMGKVKTIPVNSELTGKGLIRELEVVCVSMGFSDFEDIEGDKYNRFCKFSRKGVRYLGGRHKVTVCLRLYHDSNVRYYHVDIQVQ